MTFPIMKSRPDQMGDVSDMLFFLVARLCVSKASSLMLPLVFSVLFIQHARRIDVLIMTTFVRLC